MEAKTFYFIIALCVAIQTVIFFFFMIQWITKNRPRRRSRYVTRLEERCEDLERLHMESISTLQAVTSIISSNRDIPNLISKAGNALTDFDHLPLIMGMPVNDALIKLANSLQDMIEEIQLQISVK